MEGEFRGKQLSRLLWTSQRQLYVQASGNYTSTAPNLITATTYTTPDLAAGTYYFAVKAFDSAGNSSNYSNEVRTTIAAATALKASFSADSITGPAPLKVQFTSTSTGTITQYSWSFGDGGTSTVRNPSYTYSKPGTYTVSLAVTGSGGSNTATNGSGGSNTATKTGYISVPAAPIANFSATPTSGTTATSFNFTDSSTGNVTAWSWNFGDGTSNTSKTVLKTYSTPGNYTVSLTATGPGGSTTGPGGSNTATKTNYISVVAAPPIANFSAAPSANNSLMWQFMDSSTGTVTGWSWNFGDGTTPSTVQNPSHTYARAGTYTVNLTASGPAGSNQKTSAVTVTSNSGKLPKPWSNADIGSVGSKGDASYANGIFTLTGSGADIWGTADAFQFAYQSLNGDGTLVARVTSLDYTHFWAKTGVMIRESLNANARHAMVTLTCDGDVDSALWGALHLPDQYGWIFLGHPRRGRRCPLLGKIDAHWRYVHRLPINRW